ncbi:MAG: hypothetical protein J5744_08835 [Oscillospiraceae bacterium]|nr:hypothetical protein [Oscillospiraceae bacterium]
MSFRATIMVRYGNKAADIGYYRNWDELHLLFEAVALAAAADCCPDWKSYRTMLRAADPERDQNVSDVMEDEVVSFVRSASEYPIVIEVNRKRIRLEGKWTYAEKRKMSGRPDVLNASVDVTALLCGGGIRYTDSMLRSVIGALLGDGETAEHISKETGRVIGYLFGENAAESGKDGTAGIIGSIIDQKEKTE